jgi:signal transduction histidine kinase
MSELIDALLSLSRHARGEIQRESVDVSALAEGVLRELARTEPGRQVDWSVAPGLSARGDRRLIGVVLQNLLSNAWKYTARTPGATLRVEGEGRGSELFVRVSDNGAGFSMAHAAKLFQPFQRLHRQDEFTGIGIGLATVDRIVRRHGGTVTVDARPGEGATFRFSLPASGAQTEARNG